MRRATDYRQNARDCRELANRMAAAHRDQLLGMARQWEQLADESEAAPEKEPAVIGGGVMRKGSSDSSS